MSRQHYLLFFLVLSVFTFNPTSAHFYPNISSLPPWITGNINQTGGAWDAFNKFAGCRPGENITGLNKVKKYFQNFGYIGDTPLNFTDHFDDVLESAIKTYQKNFNLEQTGQLDQKTLQQIVRPRCGNPDIVNGTTTMNSGHPDSHNTTSIFRNIAHYSFFPGQPRWPSNRRSLTYAFWPQNQLADNVKAVFGQAFSRWSEVTQLNFTQIQSYNNADIRIAFASGEHGDGEPFDGELGTLAHAFSPPSGMFHLDNDENWVIQGTSQLFSFTAVDLESVAVHEIGHLLGLGHSSVEESIMYPTISAGTRRVQLQNDDIQGIQTLYGSNPNFNGSSSPSSVHESDTSGVHSTSSVWGHLSLFLAVGFVQMLLFS